MDANSNKGLLFQRRNSGSRLVDSRGEKGELIDRLRIRIRLSRPARLVDDELHLQCRKRTNLLIERKGKVGGSVGAYVQSTEILCCHTNTDWND